MHHRGDYLLPIRLLIITLKVGKHSYPIPSSSPIINNDKYFGGEGAVR
jgi:hypothetical protein